MALNQKAKALKAQGQSIVNLTAGEPDFPTPQRIQDAAIRALQQGKTGYTPAAGIPELRNAICEQAKKEYGRTYSTAESIVGVGAKHVLYNLCLALLNEGDEAIVLAPYWVSYVDMVALAGAKAIEIPSDTSCGFAPDIAKIKDALTDQSRLLFLNSPSNPSGAV